MNKEQEIEKLEERKRRYKRKRKANLDETQTKTLINSYSLADSNYCDNLNKNYEQNNLADEWEKMNHCQQLNECHSEISRSKDCVFLPNTLVHTEDKDYVGRYDQLHSASLVEEILHLKKHNLIQDETHCVQKMQVDTGIIHDFLFENSIPNIQDPKTYRDKLNNYIRQSLSCVYLDKISVKEKSRRISMADSLFDMGVDDEELSAISEHCAQNNQDKNPGEKRNKSCSQDSAFFEDEMDTMDTDNESMINTPTPVNVTPLVTTPVAVTSLTIPVFKEPVLPVPESTNNQMCCGGSIIIPRMVKVKMPKEAKPKVRFWLII